MRICFVSLQHPEEEGGASTFASELVYALARQGHHIHILLPEIKGMSPPHHRNIRATSIPHLRLPFLTAATFLVKTRAVISRVLKKARFDVVHCNDVAGAFLPKLPVPIVSSILHSTKALAQYVPRKIGFGLREFRGQFGFIPFLEKRAIQSSDKIIAISNLTKFALLNLYELRPDDVEVVHLGVSPDFIRMQLNPVDCPRLPGERFIFVFVGRPERRKGIDVLLEAFRKAVRINPHLLLVVIGSGDWKKQEQFIAMNGLQNHVHIKGKVGHEELVRWYRCCDAVICPSYLEGFGLSVLEGMAAGKAVLVPRWSGIRELVDIPEGGLVIDPLKPATLLHSLLYVSDDRARCKRMGDHNIEIARRLTWDETAKKTAEVYSKLART